MPQAAGMNDKSTLVPTRCRQRGDDLCSNQSGGVQHCGYDPANRATLGLCQEVCVRNLIAFLVEFAVRHNIRGEQRPDSDDAR